MQGVDEDYFILDLLSDSDKLSLPDENTFKDLNSLDNGKSNNRSLHLDMLPPPPATNPPRSTLVSPTFGIQLEPPPYFLDDY